MPHVEVRQTALRLGTARVLRRVVVAVALQERRRIVDRLGPGVRGAQRTRRGPAAARPAAGARCSRMPRAARRAGCRRSPQSAGGPRRARAGRRLIHVAARARDESRASPRSARPNRRRATRPSSPRLPGASRGREVGVERVHRGRRAHALAGRERVGQRQRLGLRDEQPGRSK